MYFVIYFDANVSVPLFCVFMHGSKGDSGKMGSERKSKKDEFHII
jgi:hypothetical protein